LSQKQLIINCYKTKIDQYPTLKRDELQIILSKELEISQRTISTTISKYEKLKKNKKKIRGNINDKIDESEKSAIRRIIHSFWFENQIPTFDKIYLNVRAYKELPNFTKSTLYSLIRKHMGFERAKGTNAVVEKNDTILCRRNYLESIMKYRSEGRPIYYMDETCINIGENAGKDCFSKDLSTRPTKPNDKDKWLVVVHIGSEDGFVDNGLFCFEAKENTNDYRVEMNGNIILDWLKFIVPCLNDYAVIIMENAPYHSLKHDDVPTSATEKSIIIEWLRSKGEIIDRPMVVAQLMAMVERIKPSYDTYVVDDFLKEHNMNVLRLPPYHCELNPIKMAWSMVKNYVNINNTTYKLDDGLELIDKAVDKVNSYVWKDFINIVVEEEKKFWDMDFIMDNMLKEQQSLFITFTDETTDASEDVI